MSFRVKKTHVFFSILISVGIKEYTRDFHYFIRLNHVEFVANFIELKKSKSYICSEIKKKKKIVYFELKFLWKYKARQIRFTLIGNCEFSHLFIFSI